ncbi:cell division protein FtsI/penicillin-binding protein 2 [secondary endosymbiont of Heteropsylla cubana]|uniref:Cell division protein FtsI/penicillin-binding protein 2 n=1 Tax=secondary endosymbiont of Heteropsylla cubana TaxID=134287 RepID=J3VUA0_9ENTR|nr:cell division protein FtsI/penicillin-binding protein 2 [secondary endosymbiont of Heteropsylla cubana]
MLKKSFDNWLTDHPGKLKVRKDRCGQIIENISSVGSQQNPNNLFLSIDKHLQALVYRKLHNLVVSNKAESETTIMLDINTGKVLAMANSPSYNLNKLNPTNIDVMRNRAITYIFEPGSTVKPMVIMTALQRRIIQKNNILNTMPYTINGHTIKDVAQYPKLTLTGVLQKSSNAGVSKLALAMSPSALVETYSRFGLGKATRLGLIGESRGLYTQKQYWSKIERTAFSCGYVLMVKPLQLARVYATIGGMGVIRSLSIIRIVNLSVIGKRVFPESLVRTILNMMESVALPGGGGSKAAIKGYRIAVKTGTSKQVGSKGTYINKYITYTTRVSPISNPCFSLVVVINDPMGKEYYGGAVSAPVFSSIMSGVLRAMNIEPDALPKLNKEYNRVIDNKAEACGG